MKVNLTKAQADAILEAIHYYEAALSTATAQGEERTKYRHLRAGADRIAEALVAAAVYRDPVIPREAGDA